MALGGSSTSVSKSAASRGLARSTEAPPSARCRRELDAVNFFMADVQRGAGPYLAVLLRAVREFGRGQIGIVMAAGSVAQLALQTPLGGLMPETAGDRQSLHEKLHAGCKD